jgi:hypothetical protein
MTGSYEMHAPLSLVVPTAAVFDEDLHQLLSNQILLLRFLFGMMLV